MKKRYKIILAVVFLAVCGAGGAFYLMQPKTVEVQTVSRGALGESVTERGRLAPQRSVTISAPIAGTVGELHFDEGQQILAGDTLLEIDASQVHQELQSQISTLQLQQSAIRSNSGLTQAELALRKLQLEQQLLVAQQDYERLFGKDGTAETLVKMARISYNQARRTYRNAEDYYDELGDELDTNQVGTGFAPGQSELAALRSQMNAASESLLIAEYNSSKTTRAYYEDLITSCEAQLEALGSNDGLIDANANNTVQSLQVTINSLMAKMTGGTIQAPIGGTLRQVLVEEGAFVSEHQPLANVYLEDGMFIEAPMLAQDALAIKVGDTALCRFADGSEGKAVVEHVSPVAEDVVSSIGLTENRCLVRLVPDKIPLNAGAGHQVDVVFSFIAAENALSVFASCIVPIETGDAVYLLREGEAVLVPVQTGIRRDGRVQILEGLQEGDAVILKPYDRGIKEGSRIITATA